jgi:RNA-dependent RNA polymerase
VQSVRGRVRLRELSQILLNGICRDYDGDTIRVLWEPELVKPFRNADTKYLLDPSTIEYAAQAFTREQTSVGQLLAAASKEDRSDQLKSASIDRFFTKESFTLASRCHTAVCYNFGPHSVEAVRAAHLFGMAMDAPKQGMVMTQNVQDDLQSEPVQICIK